ncbi:MAG: LPS assembly lipoprotein LptE [Bacteroidota bacterium]|nr:LPS assembly lipoprotein LptE [Bacteroidota bacterium]
MNLVLMVNNLRNIVIALILVIIFNFLSGCYSFKGGSVPPHLKSIAIPLFDDQSGFGEAGLREDFTNKTIEKFIQDNSFELTETRVSDSMLECTIITVQNNPSVIAAGETVTLWKITITVKAVFTDMKLKRIIYDKQISNWTEYDATTGPEARQSAIQSTIDKLTEDILLETVANW